jgi:3-oxoacyl-[acyl-carrier protein] reductase
MTSEEQTMDLQLTGNVGIVTGASRGIGRAIAMVLAEQGVRLAVVARSREPLEQLVENVKPDGLVQCQDLREPGAANAVVDSTLQHFGRLDLLVNCAGATKRGDFQALTDADWEDGFALKFYGAMRLCRAAWPHLVKSRGAIVNIVGIRGRIGDAQFTIGGSVNSALLYLTKALADRGVRDGVRVNAVNPGLIATDRLRTRTQNLALERGIDETAAAQEMQRSLGIARFGEPVEIARTVAFLVSPMAGYCQGSVVDVDGGENRTL